MDINDFIDISRQALIAATCVICGEDIIPAPLSTKIPICDKCRGAVMWARKQCEKEALENA